MMEVKRSAIAVLLLAVEVAGSSVIGSPSRNFSTVHYPTIDCGDWDVLHKMVWQCHLELFELAVYGYPWYPNGGRRNSRHNPNATDKNNGLRDALDSLDHVCDTYDRSQTCLEESHIQDYCLATTDFDVSVPLAFQVVCHQQQRDENLVRSLECLYDNRLMVMLYFHIAARCRGMGILDRIMRSYKTALFYIWDIKPIVSPIMPVLSYLCIPKSVISTCIHGIVEDHCGTMTADLVQNYLVYYQDWYGQALQSAGLSPNICDIAISSDMVPSALPVKSGHAKLGISRLLNITTSGTALDTVWGRYVLAYAQSLSGTDLCTTANAWFAYSVCVMSADDGSEKNKFNILQFAHQQLQLPYHGTQCIRLEEFTACWNLLQQICGPKVRGFEQHATLMVEGCKIQSELDTVGCHWQDMLLPHYMQASRVTVWPISQQCLNDPMNLESAHYSSFSGVMDDLDTVISLLQPGVEEISKKCGSRPAKRLRSLLHKLHYLQRDAAKYVELLYNASIYHTNSTGY